MKRLSLLLSLCLIGLLTLAQPYVWYDAAGAGNWSAAATWIKPAGVAYDYPKSSDDIVIINNSFSITADINVTVFSILLDNTGGTFGSLVIPFGRVITTTENVTIAAGTLANRSILTFNGGGTLNVGGALIIENLLETTGDCEINVGSYYKHSAGKVSFSGNIDLNISTSGTMPADLDEHNLFIGENAEFSFGTGSVNLFIDLLHGHLGTKEEIYLEAFTITNNSPDGDAISLIKNTDGSDSEFFIKGDEGLGELDIDIGAGNTLTFSHVTTPPAQPVYFREINVLSGDFILSPDSKLEITNIPPAD